MLELERHGHTIHIRGAVASNFDAKEFARHVQEANSELVQLDFSSVKSLSSEGIRNLVQALNLIQCQIRLSKCSVMIVDLLNMIGPEILKANVGIESFYAPFYCDENEATISHLLIVGKDVPLQASYQNFTLPPLIVHGKEFRHDFDPEDFLEFLGVVYKLTAAG